MRLKRTPGFLKNPGVNSGLALGGVGGWGGDDDDSVAQTHPNSITTRAVLLGIYSTFVMSDHLV